MNPFLLTSSQTPPAGGFAKTPCWFSIYERSQNGLFAGTNNFVEEVGGHPPTDIPTFVRDNPEVFK
jgi:hypothetical protein